MRCNFHVLYMYPGGSLLHVNTVETNRLRSSCLITAAALTSPGSRRSNLIGPCADLMENACRNPACVSTCTADHDCQLKVSPMISVLLFDWADCGSTGPGLGVDVGQQWVGGSSSSSGEVGRVGLG